MLFLWKSQNRLVYKLIVSILLFSGTITVIITAIQLYAEYRRDVNDIDVFISKIEKSFLSPIASSLWHFDMKSVRLQLEGILRFRDIEYLVITEEGKKVVIVGSPQTEHVIVKNIPLIYNFKNQDREIGKLTVAGSLTRIYSRLFDRAISILISQGIKTFLVSTFILMIFHLVVTRHLGSINSYLKSLDLKNLPRPLRLKRRVSTKHDELDQVVDSTNEMTVNLHESYQTINTELKLRKQAEEKLSIAYKDIEKRIEERTAELTRSNERLKAEITDRKKAEEQVKTSLKEKEVLLHEIHHRVKNNMQVTSSLLNLQSKRLKDKKIVEIFKESESRLKTMALVHDKLYQSENLADIKFKDYIDDLTKNQFVSYGVNTDNISINLEIEDIFLEIDLATSCGLIINELVLNSIKHAFPQGKEGEIKIVLRAVNEGEFELIVSDDGIGMPEDLDFESTNSFGLYIVKLITEGQLEGKIELIKKQGTEYHIQFKRSTYSM